MNITASVSGLTVTLTITGLATGTALSVDWDDGTVDTPTMPANKSPLVVTHTYANEYKRIVVARVPATGDVQYGVVNLTQITAGDLAGSTTRGRIVVDRTAAALDGDRFTIAPVTPM